MTTSTMRKVGRGAELLILGGLAAAVLSLFVAFGCVAPAKSVQLVPVVGTSTEADFRTYFTARARYVRVGRADGYSLTAFVGSGRHSHVVTGFFDPNGTLTGWGEVISAD